MHGVRFRTDRRQVGCRFPNFQIFGTQRRPDVAILFVPVAEKWFLVIHQSAPQRHQDNEAAIAAAPGVSVTLQPLLDEPDLNERVE